VLELAAGASRLARRRIDDRFRKIFRNDDAEMYRLAQNAMAGRYAWVENDTTWIANDERP